MAAALTLDYQPHRHQRGFHKSKRRIRALIAGSRGGKTLAGAAEIVMRAIWQPGYLQKDIDEGKPYTVAAGAPTFDMLRKLVIEEVFRLLPEELIVSYHESYKELIIRAVGRNRFSRIYFKNCERSERWEGLQLYAVWLDEAAQMNAAIFDEVRTRLSDRRGTLLITGTPKGKNWLYREVWKRSHNPANDIYAHCYPTIENPYFAGGGQARFDEIARLRDSMPARYFRRTYEADFDEFAGQVYDEWSPSAHVIAAIPRRGDGRPAFRRVIAGVDWGYVNPGAIVIIGITNDDSYVVIDESYATGVLLSAGRGQDSWVERAKHFRKVYGVNAWYCDPSEPEHIETFKRAGLRAFPAKNPVFAGIQDVAMLMHPVTPRPPRLRIVGHRCPKLLEFLPAYHWKENKDGQLQEAPQKKDDHLPDALRYALHTELRRGGAPQFVDLTRGRQ